MSLRKAGSAQTQTTPDKKGLEDGIKQAYVRSESNSSTANHLQQRLSIFQIGQSIIVQSSMRF